MYSESSNSGRIEARKALSHDSSKGVGRRIRRTEVPRNLSCVSRHGGLGLVPSEVMNEEGIVQDIRNRAAELKAELADFVLEAEDDLATALERFSAENLIKQDHPDMNRQLFVVDRFLVEGQVGEDTPIDRFIQAHPTLAQGDRTLLQHWPRGFMGLFAIAQRSEDRFMLRNWTTHKEYEVMPLDAAQWEKMARLKENDIVLTQIVPLTETTWMIFGAWVALGRLGKPKLAVAIGNFKNNYRAHLYSDAPELLEEAWQSVVQYHEDFVEFFGQDEVTLSGKALGQKLGELQQQTAQRRMEAAGLNSDQSFEEMAAAAGVTEADIEETASAIGTDQQTIRRVMEASTRSKMVSPEIELPPHLKHESQVTAVSHPRWGQVFLTSYPRLKAILESSEGAAHPDAASLLKQCLQDKDMNAFLWQRLAAEYPEPLEALVRQAGDRPNFQLPQDLEAWLSEHNKPLEPNLPETASVPLHLHNLFQDAVLEVNQSSSKSKTKKKTGMGFQR
jgi:hypothetical protein